jgi:hypothetical protein
MQDLVLEELFPNIRDIKSDLGWEIVHSQLFPTVAIRCFTEIIFVLASWLPSKLPAVWRCDQRGCRPVSPNSALRITLRTGGR